MPGAISPAELDQEVLESTFGPPEQYLPTLVVLAEDFPPGTVLEYPKTNFTPLAPRKLQRVARSQLTALKKRLIQQQGGVCPLSGKRFDPRKLQDAVVDHDHTTGEIRGVLSRSANAVEGKVKNAVARWGGTGENYQAIVPYLKRLVAYLERPGTGLMYPHHKTDDEKRLDRNKKAREARAKRAAAEQMKRTKQ